MKTPEKLRWLFGETIDVKEGIIALAAIYILYQAAVGGG